MATPDEEEKKVDATWVYIGRRWSEKKKKAYYVWATYDDLEEEHWYAKNLVSSHLCSPGAIYAVKTSEDAHTVFTGGDNIPKFLKMADNEELRLEWSARDRVAYQQQRVVRRIKKANADDPVKMHLDFAREEYRLMSNVERASFLGWVIWYITRGL